MEPTLLAGAVALVDRFTALLRQKDERRKSVFKELVEPLYNDTQVVAKDYRVMFFKLAESVKKNPDDVESGLDELRAARLQCKDIRLKLKQLSSAYSSVAAIKPFLGYLDVLVNTPLDRSVSYFLLESASTHVKLARMGECTLEEAVDQIVDWTNEATRVVEHSWMNLTAEYARLKMSHTLPS